MRYLFGVRFAGGRARGVRHSLRPRHFRSGFRLLYRRSAKHFCRARVFPGHSTGAANPYRCIPSLVSHLHRGGGGFHSGPLCGGQVGQRRLFCRLCLFALPPGVAGHGRLLPGGIRAAGLIFRVNPDLLGVFTKGFSETLFIPLGLAGQAALIEYVSRERRGWLACAALCLGLTAVARYSGVVWMGAGVCTMLLCARGDGRARFGKAFRFGLISILPPIALAIRNRMVSNSVAGRSLRLHPVSIDHLRDGLETIASWFLPWRFEHWTCRPRRRLGLAILTAGALWRSREPRFARASVFWVSSAAFSVLFLVHLPVAISLVGYDTALNDRILSLWRCAQSHPWAFGSHPAGKAGPRPPVGR